MKRAILTGIIVSLLLYTLVVPAAAQQTNVTINPLNTTSTLSTTSSMVNATSKTTTTSGTKSFLKATANATAPPVPGFEFIWAVIGLACATLLLLRRRR